MKNIRERVAEKGGHIPKNKAITGDTLSEVDIVRMQVEGEKDSGKSSFVLSIVRHLIRVMKLPSEAVLFCVIDFDKRGIGRLLKKGVLKRKYQKRIVYWKASDIMDGYDAWDYMEPLLKAHVEKWGTTAGAWIIVENVGQMWVSSQDYYSEIVEGMPMRDLLIKKKKEAKMKNQKAFSAFGNPRDAYKVINPLHNGLRDAITDGDYNVVLTCHLKDIYGTEEEGKEGQIVGQRGEGQKKNEADMDFIIRCHLDQKTNRHFKELRASKDTDLKFKREPDMNFTKFWEWVYHQMERESETQGYDKPDKYWLSPLQLEPQPEVEPEPDEDESDGEEKEEETKEPENAEPEESKEETEEKPKKKGW